MMKTRYEMDVTNRDSYLAAVKSRLNELDEEVEEMEARLNEVSAERRAAARSDLDDLKAQRDQFAERAHEVEKMRLEAWSEAQSGLDEAWQNITTAFERAKAHFDKSSKAV